MTKASTIGRWIHGMRRVLATVCVAALAMVIGYKVVYGANGTVEWRAKRAEYQRLQQQIDEANAEHQALEDRVRKLQGDPNTIVKEARERLSWVMPGEVVLVQPHPKSETPTTSVAQSPAPQTSASK